MITPLFSGCTYRWNAGFIEGIMTLYTSVATPTCLRSSRLWSCGWGLTELLFQHQLTCLTPRLTLFLHLRITQLVHLFTTEIKPTRSFNKKQSQTEQQWFNFGLTISLYALIQCIYRVSFIFRSCLTRSSHLFMLDVMLLMYWSHFRLLYICWNWQFHVTV